MATSSRGPRRHEIDMPSLGPVPIYAGVKVGKALDEVTEDMPLYKGVRLAQVLEAVYLQGQKDGRREVFEAQDVALAEMKSRKELAHRPPGQPKKAPAKGKKAEVASSKKKTAKSKA